MTTKQRPTPNRSTRPFRRGTITFRGTIRMGSIACCTTIACSIRPSCSRRSEEDLTKLYLQAASATLPGELSAEKAAEKSAEMSGTDTDSGAVKGSFRYTKKVLSGHIAVLEFETTVQGKYVNGVDIIEVDDDSKIIEFRALRIRPAPGGQPLSGTLRWRRCWNR